VRYQINYEIFTLYIPAYGRIRLLPAALLDWRVNYELYELYGEVTTTARTSVGTVSGVLAIAGGEFDSTTINVGQQRGC